VFRAIAGLASRVGEGALLAGGLGVALVGMAWLSRLATETPYISGVALPMVVLGLGMGAAFAPPTSARPFCGAPADAGAASGLVNVAHQLGGSLGLGMLVTGFASASPGGAHPHEVLAGRIS